MATSPIYSWPEPDNTDLVKNGALAIRTLGNAIDTTMATMTPKTIVDAKGDLIAASAADTPARLAVGNNGETLVADNSTSTGLRWQGSFAAGKNLLINGGFDIWQRGTSGFTGGGNYSADRWITGLNSGTFTASRSTDVPTSPNFNYSFSMAATSAQNAQIFQRIESVNSTPYAGQTVTLSVWAKNSAGTSKLSYVGVYPSAADNWGGSNTTDVQGDLTATSWSSSWTRYSVTFTMNALATRGYQIIFYRNGTETSTTLFAGAQLEIGSVATNFSRAGGTIQGELAACQRYFWAYNVTDSNTQSFNTGLAISSTRAIFPVRYPMVMRTKPSLGASANSNFVVIYGGYSSATATSIGMNNGGAQAFELDISVASGLTTGGAAMVGTTGNASAYLWLSAEL